MKESNTVWGAEQATPGDAGVCFAGPATSVGESSAPTGQTGLSGPSGKWW